MLLEERDNFEEHFRVNHVINSAQNCNEFNVSRKRAHAKKLSPDDEDLFVMKSFVEKRGKGFDFYYFSSAKHKINLFSLT